MKKIHLGFVQLYSDNYEKDIELPDDFVMSETYRFTRDDGMSYQRYYVSIYKYDENLYKYLISFDSHFRVYKFGDDAMIITLLNAWSDELPLISLDEMNANWTDYMQTHYIKHSNEKRYKFRDNVKIIEENVIKWVNDDKNDNHQYVEHIIKPLRFAKHSIEGNIECAVVYCHSIFNEDTNIDRYEITNISVSNLLYESLMFDEKKVVGDFEDEFVERLVELLHLGGIDV